MKAAWYEETGPPEDVLRVGELGDPVPGEGEVRIRIVSSGINPGDVKKRQDAFGVGLAFPRIVPHSDGAGVIDAVGPGVYEKRIGERVWCFGAQSYRPFGTAAEFCVVPTDQAVELPDDVSFEIGACLGIPGLTAYRAVTVAGDPKGRNLLIQGGAGAVGQCAVALAHSLEAFVIATVRTEADVEKAKAAGADEVIETGSLSRDDMNSSVLGLFPEGVDHIVEVAFHTNIEADETVLRLGGSIATFASGVPDPKIPFWPLVFKNVSVHFLGSDDFKVETKIAGARAINRALTGGWDGPVIGASFGLGEIVAAHQAVENREIKDRVVLQVV
ncbi:MAG: NADPH:quinone reductase [Acidobacteriota bacterium]|nr:MAG: NADPH:quinone reductase [Acidobacteriota bacterium]